MDTDYINSKWIRRKKLTLLEYCRPSRFITNDSTHYRQYINDSGINGGGEWGFIWPKVGSVWRHPTNRDWHMVLLSVEEKCYDYDNDLLVEVTYKMSKKCPDDPINEQSEFFTYWDEVVFEDV